jgi:AcrR family transcriptional regulator
MTQNESRRGARRQARGLQRRAEILDAAGEVFSEIGYEEATTNAIAARAGISPGSLYQFFPNKVAIGNALAERYMDDFLALWKRLATPEAVALPIPALVDYMIDPLNAFTRGKLGFQVVFASSDVSPRVAVLGEEMHFGVIKILGDWIAARAPHLPPDQCNLMAEVIVRIYKSFMPALLDPDLERGERLMDEMKAVLRSYLSATLGGT